MGDLVQVEVRAIQAACRRRSRFRAGSDRRGCAAGDRQPHRPGDARWSAASDFARAQVQSRDAGEAPGRVLVQAVHLHDGASIAAIRRSSIFVDEPISLRRRPNQPAVRAAQLRPQYEGSVARRAIEDSRNVPAVKAPRGLGPGMNAIKIVARFRAAAEHAAVTLAGARVGGKAAVGHDERAHRVPEPGVRMRSTRSSASRTARGNVLEENGPGWSSHDGAVRADTAFATPEPCRVASCSCGTAAGAMPASIAHWPRWPARRDDGRAYRCAGLIGFDPGIITVGAGWATTRKKPLGTAIDGAVAALLGIPALDFREGLYIGHARRSGKNASACSEAPGNIVFVIASTTGVQRSVHQRHAAAWLVAARRNPAVSPASNHRSQ